MKDVVLQTIIKGFHHVATKTIPGRLHLISLLDLSTVYERWLILSFGNIDPYNINVFYTFKLLYIEKKKKKPLVINLEIDPDLQPRGTQKILCVTRHAEVTLKSRRKRC